jgi:hypothetical protein
MTGMTREASLFLLAATAYRCRHEHDADRLSKLAVALTPHEACILQDNAAYHELEPLLHTIVTDCSESGIALRLPPHLPSRWAEVHEREMARSAIIHYGAVKALRALEEAGVRAIPLKGFYLAASSYERKSARAFKDLDLLVERAALEDLNEALLGAGFLPAPDRPSFVPAPAYTVYSLPVEGSDTAMEIDIHIGMHWPAEYDRRTELRAEDLWSKATQEEVGGMRLWALSTEHLLITTFLDVAINHRYARLVKFRDVLEVLRRAEVDWDEMAECCRRWRVLSFICPGLRFMGEIDERLAIPASMFDSLLPPYAAMRAFLRALPLEALPGHRSRSFSLANLLFFLLADTPGERARGLLHMPRHMFRGRHRF